MKRCNTLFIITRVVKGMGNVAIGFISLLHKEGRQCLDSLFLHTSLFRVHLYVAATRFKEKHSLDSDEEDEKDEKQEKGLDDEDMAAQEDSTIVRIPVVLGWVWSGCKCCHGGSGLGGVGVALVLVLFSCRCGIDVGGVLV